MEASSTVVTKAKLQNCSVIFLRMITKNVSMKSVRSTWLMKKDVPFEARCTTGWELKILLLLKHHITDLRRNMRTKRLAWSLLETKISTIFLRRF